MNGPPAPQPALRAAPNGLSIGSPANLLSPDRYEFYTFDETGDLVRRRMTLDEIKSLLAGGDGDLGDSPIATFYHGPVAALSESIPSVAVAARDPEDAFEDAVKGVQDVVNNVQNVLKMQLAASKNKLPSYIPAPRPPPQMTPADATAAWSMLLPSIMENAVSTQPPSIPYFTRRTTAKPELKPTEASDKPLRQSLRPTRPSPKPVDTPADKVFEKPVERPIEKPFEKTTDKPTVKPYEKPPATKPAEKISEKPEVKPVERPMEKATPRTPERPVSRPVPPTIKSTDKPFTKAPEKPTPKPPVKPSQKPGSKPTGKPANRPPGVSHFPTHSKHPPISQVKEGRPLLRPRPESPRPTQTTTTPRPYTMPSVHSTTAGNPSEEMNKLSLLYTLVSSSPNGASILRNHSSSFIQSMMSSFPPRTTTLKPAETKKPDPDQYKQTTQEAANLKPVALKSPPPEQMVKVPIIQRPHQPSTTASYLGNTHEPAQITQQMTSLSAELKQPLATDSAIPSSPSTVQNEAYTIVPQSSSTSVNAATAPPKTTTEPPVFTTVFYVSGSKDKNHEDPVEVKTSDIEIGSSNHSPVSTEAPTTKKSPSIPPMSTLTPYHRPAIIQKINFTKLAGDKKAPSSTTTSSWVTFKTDPTPSTQPEGTEATSMWTTTSLPNSSPHPTTQVLNQALLTRVPASVFLQKLQLKTEAATEKMTTEAFTTEAVKKTAASSLSTQPLIDTTPTPSEQKTTFTTEKATEIPTEPYTKTFLKISSVTSPKKEPAKIVQQEKITDQPLVTTEFTTEASKESVISTTQSDYSTIEPKVVTTIGGTYETVSLFQNPSAQQDVVTASPEDNSQADKLDNKSEAAPASSDKTTTDIHENVIESRTEGTLDLETEGSHVSTIRDSQEMATEHTTILDDDRTTTEMLNTVKNQNELLATTSPPPYTTIPPGDHKGSVEAVTYTTEKQESEASKPEASSTTSFLPETTTLKAENEAPEQNWTRISVLNQVPASSVPPPPPPQAESGYHSPSSVELHAAPHENLGLEASTTSIDPDIHGFVNLCNELAFQMWNAVKDGTVSSARSLVLSPFAATSQLAMVFLGARGPTSGQMNDVLRLDDMVSFNPHQVMKNITESVLHSKNPGIATAALIRELYSDKVSLLERTVLS